MTREAKAGVDVDWQVQLTRGTSMSQAQKVISSAPGVLTSLPVAYADTPGFSAKTGGSFQTTGSGQVVGYPAGYADAFPGEVRFLVGARSGALLAQQTAANLQASVGSTIGFKRPGLAPVAIRIDGIIDLPQADSMFQAVGVAPSAAPRAPPDNVLLLPDALWHRYFDPVAKVQPSDPSAAFAQVLARAKNLEAQLSGGGVVGDNLGAQLDAGRSDALYAQLL